MCPHVPLNKHGSATVIPLTASVSTAYLSPSLMLYLLPLPLLSAHPGPEAEACVGVSQLTGLSGLCLLRWLFPFPLLTTACTAAVYPTVTTHTHTEFTDGG